MLNKSIKESVPQHSLQDTESISPLLVEVSQVLAFKLAIVEYLGECICHSCKGVPCLHWVLHENLDGFQQLNGIILDHGLKVLVFFNSCLHGGSTIGTIDKGVSLGHSLFKVILAFNKLFNLSSEDHIKLLLLIGSGSIVRLSGCLHCGHVLAKVNLLHSYERVCYILAAFEIPLDFVDQMVLDCREGSSSSLAGSMRGELVFNLGSGLVLLVIVEPAPVEVALSALGVVSSSTTTSGLGTMAVVVPAHGKDEYNRL
jgi:hypothetical protein